MIRAWTKRSARRKYRDMLRGFRKLRASASPNHINKLNSELTNEEIGIPHSFFERFIFGSVADRVEICLRQLLLAKLASRPLNTALLRSLGRPGLTIRFPLPKEWIVLIQRSGYKVSERSCRLMLLNFGVQRLFLALARFLGMLVNMRFKRPKTENSRYVQFVDLAFKNLPIPGRQKKYDIVSWYVKWDGAVEELEEIRHTVRTSTQSNLDGVIARSSGTNIPGFQSMILRLNFLAWGIGAFCVAAFSLLLARPWSAILLEDAVQAKAVNLLPSDKLAREYLFSCSGIVKRPLWTYVAELKGSVISLYYYSAGLPFRDHGVDPHHEIGFESMTWSRILQFSDHQIRFTRAAVGSDVEVLKVPPIFFSDVNEQLPDVAGTKIALFDSSPTRISQSASRIPDSDYRSVSNGTKFLEDVHHACRINNITLLWKQKRAHSARHNKQYLKFAKEFAERPGVVLVHPDIAAARLIEVCDAVVSIPYTSTGLLAKYFDKPSVFHDPAESLDKADEANLGIPLVCGRKNLEQWVERQALSRLDT